MSDTIYQERDLENLGEYYTGHVVAMTREGLHSKSAIAAELAHRDKELDELRAEVERLKADKARLDWLFAPNTQEKWRAVESLFYLPHNMDAREAIDTAMKGDA